jgi:hypothetical protein
VSDERVTPADGPPPERLDAVEAARERLAAVEDAPLDEHVTIYDDVHRGLQEGLADLDES